MGSPEMMTVRGEKFSSIKRVIGVPPQLEGEIKKDFAEKFRNQDFLYFDMGIKEREKTRGQIEIIQYAGQLAADVCKEYGGEGIKIPERNIHILNEKDFNRYIGSGMVYHDPSLQAVFLRGNFSLLNFPLEFIHRTMQADLHFLSYQTIKFVKDDSIWRHLKDRSRFAVGQSGMYMPGEKSRGGSFENLNNAVIEKLAKDVLQKEIFSEEVLKAKNPRLFELVKGEIEETEKLRQVAKEPDEVLLVKNQSDSSKGFRVIYMTFNYSRERAALDGLIDKLYLKNKDKEEFRIKKEDEIKKEIFSWFAKSVFTGDLKPLEKSLNESFGTDTYNALAKADRNVKKLGKFVGSLKV